MSSGTTASHEPSEPGLVILDDRFPDLLTAFRVVEFTRLLRAFPDALCLSSDPAFDRDIVAFARLYPDVAPRVRRWAGVVPRNTRLAYAVGLNTVLPFLPAIEAARVPYALELYPGFGLHLGDAAADARLVRVLGDPALRRVIATQSVTLEHLAALGFAGDSRIAFRYGGVIDTPRFLPVAARRVRRTSPPFEIAFVAAKYTPSGRDKGYDVFVDAARQLAAQSPGCFVFHVVGNFGPADYPIGELRVGSEIVFHGLQPAVALRALYREIDAIVSPNRPSVLAPGAFDGFPTGAVVDAMLAGVAAYVTDPLGCNAWFEAEREIVVIDPEPSSVAATLSRAFAAPDRVAAIGQDGRLRAAELFDLESQMAFRLEALRSAWL